MKKLPVTTLLFPVLFGLSSHQVLANCGNITIAEMNWATAEFVANLDKIILSEGYGCEVELVPGATNTTFASMETKGKPDIAPEFWGNSVSIRLKEAQKKGDLTLGVQLITDASEGWFVSKMIATEYPDINTVDDVLARPELFPSKESPSYGAFMNCPSGWACQDINLSLSKESAYNFKKAGFLIVDPGASAGIESSIAKAYQRNEAWFGYYWQPTVAVEKYGLKKLDFAADFDEENWHQCITDVNCDSPQRTPWIKSNINTVMSTPFVKDNPELMNYLNKRSYTSAQVGSVITYMDENQANGEDAAYYFLENNTALWRSWLPTHIADKVAKAL